MPQETSNGVHAEGTAGVVPEDPSTIADVSQRLADAAAETTMQLPERNLEITPEAPAILVPRSIEEAIERGVLRPGKKLHDTDLIYINRWEPVSPRGVPLGKEVATFAAPENLQIHPQTFGWNASNTGAIRDWYGFAGWAFDSKRYCTSSYEVGLHKAYRDGSAFGKWTIPELPLLSGNDRHGRVVSANANMLVLSKDPESDFFESFVTITGEFGAQRAQSCTETGSVFRVCVYTIQLPAGKVYTDQVGDHGERSCVRPVLSVELESKLDRLIL